MIPRLASSSNGDYFGFDALGRQTIAIQQTGGANYQASTTFNRADEPLSLTYPSGHVVNYNYDRAGRLADKDQGVAFSGNLGDGITRTYSFGIVYSPFGGLSKEQFGTDTPIFNKLFYNVRGQLAEIRESTSYSGTTDTTANGTATAPQKEYGYRNGLLLITADAPTAFVHSTA